MSAGLIEHRWINLQSGQINLVRLLQIGPIGWPNTAILGN